MKRILHLSFHTGCFNDICYIAETLGYDIEHMKFDDGVTKDNEIYNVTHQRAFNAWEKYKDFYNTFDIIITSDTCPISRTFLQNNFDKKLIIWVCNRFDYRHGNPSDFPDKEYYELIKDAKNKENVKIIGYTKFENYYAKNIKNIDIGIEVIKPIGKLSKQFKENSSFKNLGSEIPSHIDKSKTFFLPPYHNETILMDLSSKLNEYGIKNYNGRYRGPQDLKAFKGIIHIPYAWSNLALFENIQNGIIYFIPSKNFLHKLKNMSNKFWFSPPFDINLINLSEWYNDENKELFVYFESWENLKHKIETTNYEEKRNYILTFAKNHEDKYLEKWKLIL